MLLVPDGLHRCRSRTAASNVGAQGRVELSETLDQLLELGSLLWVQGPATGHHCEPGTAAHPQGLSGGENLTELVSL